MLTLRLSEAYSQMQPLLGVRLPLIRLREVFKLMFCAVLKYFHLGMTHFDLNAF